MKDPSTEGHTEWGFTEQVNPEAKGFAGAQEYGWGGWLMGAVSGERNQTVVTATLCTFSMRLPCRNE